MIDYYELLKAQNGIPISNKYVQMLGQSATSNASIKTLTGALPLTFMTSETALRSWTLHGAHMRHTIAYPPIMDYPAQIFAGAAGAADTWTIYGNAEGVGERTKNLFQITENGNTVNGVTYITDIDEGTATFLGTCTATNSICPIGYITFSEDSYVYLSGGADGGSNDRWYLYAYDMTAGARPKKWDGTSTSVSVFDSQTSQEILCPAGHSIRIAGLVRGGVTVNNIVFKPMLRAADTTPEFIPYGYQIPLTVSQGQTDKNYEIFIGDAPLGEGESVSDTQPIEVFEGVSTISTTLANKPRIDITVFDYYGIASRVNGDYYQVKFKVTHNGSTRTIYIPVPNSMDEGDTVTNINPIPTEIGENTISLNWNTYPTTTMTIKYKE